MLLNKIINVILFIAAVVLSLFVMYEYIIRGEFHTNAFLSVAACVIAIFKPGRIVPPLKYYRKIFDIITPNSFEDKRAERLFAIGVSLFIRKKYTKALVHFDKMLEKEILSDEDVSIISVFREGCVLDSKRNLGFQRNKLAIIICAGVAELADALDFASDTSV